MVFHFPFFTLNILELCFLQVTGISSASWKMTFNAHQLQREWKLRRTRYKYMFFYFVWCVKTCECPVPISIVVKYIKVRFLYTLLCDLSCSCRKRRSQCIGYFLFVSSNPLEGVFSGIVSSSALPTVTKFMYTRCGRGGILLETICCRIFALFMWQNRHNYLSIPIQNSGMEGGPRMDAPPLQIPFAC
jgi:hypothetical protein